MRRQEVPYFQSQNRTTLWLVHEVAIEMNGKSRYVEFEIWQLFWVGCKRKIFCEFSNPVVDDISFTGLRRDIIKVHINWSEHPGPGEKKKNLELARSLAEMFNKLYCPLSNQFLAKYSTFKKANVNFFFFVLTLSAVLFSNKSWSHYLDPKEFYRRELKNNYSKAHIWLLKWHV